MMLLQLLCSLGFIAVINSNVIGIDFGSDSMKVAIVPKGSPLDIVTNFQSKRKTPMSLSFYRNERQFGADSIALLTRKPELTFSKIYRMIGRSPEHPHIKQLLEEQYFAHNLYTNETSGFTSVREGEMIYTAEELVAMMMQHAKDMTESSHGSLIKDCVVTVPSYFTQHERNSLYAAADIADLTILSLIEENTAAALHYGMDRVFDSPSTVLYYNMGAGSVQVSIVTYSSFPVKEGGKNKTVGQFEVIGKAWDSSLGGFNFDVKLAELLADRFNVAWQAKKKPIASGASAADAAKDIKLHQRAMTRLRGEATKIKEILSANNEYPVRVEQLHADVDLVTKITRAQLEEACESLFARMTGPIDAALKQANLTLADVQAVELLGGAVRMPRAKKVLDDYFKHASASSTTGAASADGSASGASVLELGQHLNGDEAMALGAAFRAANLSTAFRVRKVGMQDFASFGVSVHLETLPVAEVGESGESQGGFFSGLFGSKKATESATASAAATPPTDADAAGAASDASTVWVKQTEIFAARSLFSAKAKVVSFIQDKDILCRIQYSDTSLPLLPHGTDPLLAMFNITGITAFTAAHASKNASAPKVQLSFVLGGDGVVSLLRAEVTAELPAPVEVMEEEMVLVEPVVESSENATTTDAATDATVENNTTATTTTTNSTNTTSNDASGSDAKTDKKADKKSSNKKDKKSNKKESSATFHKKETTLRSPLTISQAYHATHPAAWSPAAIAESKAKLRALEEADKARQAKEAALNDLEAYCYKVKNRLSDDEEVLATLSTEAERDAIVTLANTAEEWIYEDGRDADVKAFAAKQLELVKLSEKVFHRQDELTARPAAVKAAGVVLSDIKGKIAEWGLTKPHITSKETDLLLETVTKVEDWLDLKAAEQAGKSAMDPAAFESVDVSLQLKPLQLQFDKLSRKPKPAPPAAEKETKKKGGKKNASGNNNGTTTNNTSGEANETIVLNTTNTGTDANTTTADFEPVSSDDEL